MKFFPPEELSKEAMDELFVPEEVVDRRGVDKVIGLPPQTMEVDQQGHFVRETPHGPLCDGWANRFLDRRLTAGRTHITDATQLKTLGVDGSVPLAVARMQIRATLQPMRLAA